MYNQSFRWAFILHIYIYIFKTVYVYNGCYKNYEILDKHFAKQISVPNMTS